MGGLKIMNKDEIDRVVQCFIDGEEGWTYNLKSTGNTLVSRARGGETVIARRVNRVALRQDDIVEIMYLNDLHRSTLLYRHLLAVHCRLARKQLTFRYFNHSELQCQHCACAAPLNVARQVHIGVTK